MLPAVFLLVVLFSWIWTATRPDPNRAYIQNGVALHARTRGKALQVYQNGQWKPLFVKGVNLGTARPGKWLTEFPQEKSDYERWLTQIGTMNANTVRVYTLMPPAFYQALSDYNEDHRDCPMWLLQGIWPDESPPGGNDLDGQYQTAYRKEIQNVIGAVHGNRTISKRRGHAFGEYTADVSPFVLGWLAGRPLEPDEVTKTNQRNPGYVFKGEYLVCAASPAEAWLASSCDYVLKTEEQAYRCQHPVAIVSWPALDPISHDSEWNRSGDKMLEYNDRASIDIGRIEPGSKLKAGLFGAYHIYPNYPDFMNNEPAYDAYRDDQGRLRYGGYLKEFMAGHTKYPALVAEYGLSTSLGKAHASSDGYSQGGLTETEQGRGIIRMMKAIKREGYAGGVICEWMDEWAKKSWITEPFTIPYERKILWHNLMDPEQNYGILAMESVTPAHTLFEIEGEGLIESAGVRSDETYVYLDISMKQAFDRRKQKMLLGLDTYKRQVGEFRYNGRLQTQAPSGMEFVIELGRSGRIRTVPSYNAAGSRFASTKSAQGDFVPERWLINEARVTRDGRTIPAVWFDASVLRYGKFTTSDHQWYVSGNKIYLRLPWGQLHFTDPSSHQVLNDRRVFSSVPGRDVLKTAMSDGIVVTAVLTDASGSRALDVFPGVKKVGWAQTYIWLEWKEPRYAERLKNSYAIIRDGFAGLR